MKRISLIIVAMLLLMSLASCGESNTGGNVDISDADNTVSTSSPAQSEPENTEKADSESLGKAPVVLAAYNRDNLEQYFRITFPADEGKEIYRGRGAIADDGTMIICGSSFLNGADTCDSVEDIYDEFKSVWEESALDMRPSNAYTDSKFTAEKRELTEINGFSMCRYEGTYTYNYTDLSTNETTAHSCFFVAYGTQLSEGGYAYWIAFDDTEDQSLRDAVILHAENMAKSLEEVDVING